MLNKKKIQVQIEQLKSRITAILNELTLLEPERAISLKDYKQLDFNQQKHCLFQIGSANKKSLDLLENFEKNYCSLLGYILLIKQEGHHNPEFQLLLKKYKLFENYLIKLKGIRTNQNKLIDYLIKQDSTGFFFRWNQRRLFKFFVKEKKLFLILCGICVKGIEELEFIEGLIKQEKIEGIAFAGVAGLAWLVPFVGTALSVAIFKIHDWAKAYSVDAENLLMVSN